MGSRRHFLCLFYQMRRCLAAMRRLLSPAPHSPNAHTHTHTHTHKHTDTHTHTPHTQKNLALVLIKCLKAMGIVNGAIQIKVNWTDTLTCSHTTLLSPFVSQEHWDSARFSGYHGETWPANHSRPVCASPREHASQEECVCG